MSHFEILAPNQVGVCKREKMASLANTSLGLSVSGFTLSFFFREMILGVTLLGGPLSSLSVCTRVCCSLFFSLSM